MASENIKDIKPITIISKNKLGSIRDLNFEVTKADDDLYRKGLLLIVCEEVDITNGANWNNTEFSQFIEKIQAGSADTFTFIIENPYHCSGSTKWSFDDNILTIEEWCCGKLYKRLDIEITPEIIEHLTMLKKEIGDYPNHTGSRFLSE